MYDELVKRIWECASGECFNCSQYTETTNASVCQKELMKQAADAIEELSVVVRAQKAVLDKFPKWIPVTARLPKDDTICILTDGVSEAIGYRGKVFGWHLIWTDYLAESDITHWMPLPEPPKEEI